MSDDREQHDPRPTEAELRAVERWADAVDAAARGELDADALAELEREAEHDAWLREALADARAVRAHVRDLPRLEAPADLDARILAAVDREHRPRRARGPAPRATLRWIATAAVAAAAAFVLFVGPTPWRSAPNTFVAADGTVFTEDEVRAAAEQVEMAMAVLNGELDRTSSIVGREMKTELREHVADPVRRSFGQTVDSIPFLRDPARDDQHSGLRFPPTGERPLRSHARPGALHGERT